MSWNYRVIRSENARGVFYAIHECHYEKNGEMIPTSWAAEPANVLSDSRRELLLVMSMMAEAFKRPVLEETEDGRLIKFEPGLT